MEIQLSEHFDYRKLLRFTLPSVVMMMFTSVYSVVDGVFVSNFVGKTPFAAINLVFPFLMMFGAVGFMLGTGGSALVAMMLGAKDERRAHRTFSMLVYVSVAFAGCLSLVGQLILPDVVEWLGAEGEMAEYGVLYGRILLCTLPAFLLQFEFQSFMIAAERPKFGLYVTIAAGVGNILLDFLFIVVFGWGLTGAAIATAVSQCIGGLLPLVYFALPNKSLLQLTKTSFDGRALLQASTNGMSEFLTNISGSLVSMLYNFQLMRYIGEDGVAAFGVIMYVNFIFLAVFLGYSIGAAPIVSYHYGAQNHAELRNVFRRSLHLTGLMGILLVVLAEVLALPLAKIFVGYDPALLDLTRRAFMIYCVSFLLAGFNIYGSSFFTALNNGVVSAVISVSRTLVCETTAVLLLPLFFGLDGIWMAISFAEFAALMVTVALLRKHQARYRY